ncbi:hypothetical protein AGMMS49573_03650 [Endomicrobiia bacterium]|uniref:hypothetical protein n=1 Tax=Endomicrobium trichonymphae TaxID=1408204 RepID=UPI000BAA8BE7|nr:hypothetical protein AGMMS49532_00610 [Endomicrobiia bacterium]GHT15880.1 hypothetical protein AGMMS49573_03650 [Endomicrobiia bacterium]GHT19946.1 hypothetical protein AGMMS49929_04980 [Endomicrobiia bacterium]GHT25600.1 hypothetical protein AGMMS49953_10560 [Endomicrobiia bacterium]GHT26504.1 hypothetical protein AGMMS49995_03300 [Endomicrobiia bacterium]
MKAVTAIDSKFSVMLMAKAIAFRNAANKIVDKNIEYSITKKEMDIDNYPESELLVIIKRIIRFT